MEYIPPRYVSDDPHPEPPLLPYNFFEGVEFGKFDPPLPKIMPTNSDRYFADSRPPVTPYNP